LVEAALLVVAVSACGRIGYDARTAPPDAAVDGAAQPVDAVQPVDALPVCAADTIEITAGSSVCIELTRRGTEPWTLAKSTCEGLGRRLCADAEWFTGCTNAPGVMNMTGDSWEWVAEEAGGVAQKRGASGCADISAHAIVDPYGYRCCDDK
jgi:hypothetical protein